MNFWQKIGFYLLLWISKAAGKLPYRFMYYGVTDVVYFFMYKIARYRVGVVRQNLRNSFPEKTEAELYVIEKRFFKHLSEVFVDTVVMSSISEEKIRKRFDFVNGTEQEKRTGGTSWICAMAHYGSWEYTINYKLFTDHRVAAVYRPLHNKTFDAFYKYVRSRFGSEPIPMNDIAREVIDTRRKNKTPMAIALIADQTPPRHEIHHWFDFLNQPTPFFMGTEKLARKFNLPIYFLKVTKIKRGYYNAEFVELFDGMEHVEEFEIMTRYARMLEEMIRECPELWLWSHKRWKHKPSTDEKNGGSHS